MKRRVSDSPRPSFRRPLMSGAFKIFDDNDLAILHQDETAGSETSRFFKLLNRKD